MRQLLTAVSFAALAFTGLGIGVGMIPGAAADEANVRIADVRHDDPALEGDSDENHRQVG